MLLLAGIGRRGERVFKLGSNRKSEPAIGDFLTFPQLAFFAAVCTKAAVVDVVDEFYRCAARFLPFAKILVVIIQQDVIFLSRADIRRLIRASRDEDHIVVGNLRQICM